jgi:hypothetical protein
MYPIGLQVMLDYTNRKMNAMILEKVWLQGITVTKGWKMASVG